MTVADATLTEIKVSLATLNGRFETLSQALTGSSEMMAQRIEASQRQSEQLVALIREQMQNLAGDQGELKAVVRENEVKANEAISTVRVDLEKADANLRRETKQSLDALKDAVEEFGRWRSRVMGQAAILGSVAGFVMALAVKAWGG